MIQRLHKEKKSFHCLATVHQKDKKKGLKTLQMAPLGPILQYCTLLIKTMGSSPSAQTGVTLTHGELLHCIVIG